MRLTVKVFGHTVVEVSTEADAPEPPSVEATSGGQFDIGFSALRDGEVTCQQRRARDGR